MIVALGLYIPGTGFTRVFHTLFQSLCAEFEIHWIGIAYKGAVTDHGAFMLYPNNLAGGDIFGAYGTERLATTLRADIVLLINDVWMLKNYAHTLANRSWTTVAYVPLDGTLSDPTHLSEALWLDAIVAYHHTARKEFLRAIEVLQTAESGNLPEIHAIYHGVDTDHFHPPEHFSDDPEWRLQYKRRFFGHIDGWEEAIFILNANRYNERKDLRTTIAGFAQARTHLKNNAILCLHTPSMADQQRQVLNTWIAELDLEYQVIVNPALDGEYLDEYALRELYYACEIGVNTSLGEGWGLISFEHAACLGAQILPAQPGLLEIWEDSASCIQLKEEVLLPTNPFPMRRSSATDLGLQLVQLCNEKEHRTQMALKAYTHARAKQFNWQSIARKWTDLLLGYCK